MSVISRHSDELSLRTMSRHRYERSPDLKHRWGHKQGREAEKLPGLFALTTVVELVQAGAGCPTDIPFIRGRAYALRMATLVIILLAVWLIVAVIGFVFEGLMWLAVVALILFVATAAVGWVRRKSVER